MTISDLLPILQLQGATYNLLMVLTIVSAASLVISLIRLGIVIYRSVKGRMDRV